MLRSHLSLQLEAQLTGTHDFSPPSAQLNKPRTFRWSDGTGAGQANRVFADRRQLAASANESLDLAGGLTDALGATITLAKVRALLIEADAGNTNTLVVGGAAANAFASLFGDATDKIVVRPGGLVLIVAPDATGYAVTAGTGDLLQVANGGAGTPVTFDITVIGATA